MWSIINAAPRGRRGRWPFVRRDCFRSVGVDEAGDEVDPRTGEKLVKQIEEPEPVPQPVAKAPAPPPEAAPERLEGTMEEEEDDEDDTRPLTRDELKTRTMNKLQRRGGGNKAKKLKKPNQTR